MSCITLHFYIRVAADSATTRAFQRSDNDKQKGLVDLCGKATYDDDLKN